MAARQSALERGGEDAGAEVRPRPRRYPTVGEAAKVGEVAANAAPMPAGWTPSRFFEAWKKKAVKASSGLFLNYMVYYRGFPPRVRKQAIDSIIRATMVKAYKTDDFFEGYRASHNDYDAMWSYSAAFLDAFWEELCAKYRADNPDPVGRERRALA